MRVQFFSKKKYIYTSILDCEQSSTDGKFCQKLWTLRASALHWLRLQCFAECTSKEVQGDSNEFDRPAAEHKNTRTPRVSSIFNAISRLVVLCVVHTPIYLNKRFFDSILGWHKYYYMYERYTISWNVATK